jgi:hypothetical protein
MEFTTWIEVDVPRVECATRGIKLALRALQPADFKVGRACALTERFRTS